MNKEKYTLLIIIPARKESKGIQNKNIRKIKGHPLLSYSIEAAKKINIKKKIIHLSTDCDKIIHISKKYYPFNLPLRPKSISSDKSLDIDFVNNTLEYYCKKKIFFKFCMILRPTNPIRKLKTINNFINRFKNTKYNSVKSIHRTKGNPFKMWITKKNNEIKNVTNYNKKEFFNYPRQQLPNTYSQTGTIEILRIEFRKNIKLFSGKKIMGLEVSEKESLDIDTIEDLKIAGKIINKKTMIFPKVIF